MDWAATPDWEFDSAKSEDAAAVEELWRASIARSRSVAASAFEKGGLGVLTLRTWPDGRAPSLRLVMTHMIEEYARHSGHADFLREAIDGQVGD